MDETFGLDKISSRLTNDAFSSKEYCFSSDWALCVLGFVFVLLHIWAHNQGIKYLKNLWFSVLQLTQPSPESYEVGAGVPVWITSQNRVFSFTGPYLIDTCSKQWGNSKIWFFKNILKCCCLSTSLTTCFEAVVLPGQWMCFKTRITGQR